jgi:hypothetical protein
VVFVADDLGAWLVGLLADAGRKKLTTLVLGSDQERALRKAADDALQGTAAAMNLSAEQARRLAMVISETFRKPGQDAVRTGSVTMLEVLQAGIAGQLAGLDDSGRTTPGQSLVEVLGVPSAVLAEKLTGNLVREIMLRGSGGGPLTPLADQLNHDLTHLQGRRVEGMLARLVALISTVPAPSAWAGDPVREIGPARPAGAVRVGEADPRRMGVHAAISVPGVSEEVLPEYVPRDVDAAEHGVRARVAAAAERGGFVLLVGGSSVGKTRCAVEAVKAVLPDWWLVHPAGPADVARLAQAPSPRMVVWLDELQRYLDGEQGLTGAVVRTLLNAPDPVVITGTLWPDRYAAYAAMPAPGGPDPHAREREVLDLAAIVRVSPEFSAAEQDRSRAAAARDRRLSVALESTGYGLTQTLAAAPQLVARWEDARDADPYAWAVLTAALDAARLGAHTSLSIDFLRDAAPGYCTSRQQAEAPDGWLDQALAYATAKLHGAAAALAPAGIGMGHIGGYSAADYLVQHVTRERRHAQLPASAWDAIVSHIDDPADASRLAESADNRLLYRYAIPLYRTAADAGDGYAAYRLAELLAEHGDLDELRARADAGDGHAAAYRLAELLAEHGDLDELRARADAGDGYAAYRLAELLAERGDLDELRARADAGDAWAAHRLTTLPTGREYLDSAVQLMRAQVDAGHATATLLLARLLAEHGDLDELHARADAGDEWAAYVLAEMLAEHGDLDELRARANAGDGNAAVELARLLAEHGDLDSAVQLLRTRADAGDATAAYQLAELLAERGDLDELRARADAGDGTAALRLAGLLAERGDLDELRARADADGGTAALRLAELLAERGDLDELRARADAGDASAARVLVHVLAGQGPIEEAERLRRFGLNPDGSIASALHPSMTICLRPRRAGDTIGGNGPLPLITRTDIS